MSEYHLVGKGRPPVRSTSAGLEAHKRKRLARTDPQKKKEAPELLPQPQTLGVSVVLFLEFLCLIWS